MSSRIGKALLLSVALAGVVGCGGTALRSSSASSSSSGSGTSSSPIGGASGSNASSGRASASSSTNSVGASGSSGSGSSGASGSSASTSSGSSASTSSGSSASTSSGSGTTGVTCRAITPAPDVDPFSVRVPSAGAGAISSAVSGVHTDVFLDSPASATQAAGYIRIGARLDWGGTIVFFGLGADPTSNVIDANDTGRELQIALYDPQRVAQGCAYNASCAVTPSSCPVSISYLGWDPVQGGDRCGHGGTVLSHGPMGDGLRLVVQPLQWNPDWSRPDCTQSACGPSGVPVNVSYTFDLRFVSTNVVEIATEVTSQETISHDVTAQEFPTLYVSHGQGGPDLPVLRDSSGASPAMATPANDGFFYGTFTSPAPWVSWQDQASDYGVALAMDQGVRSFQGWRGNGTTAPYFHNVRANLAFGLPAGGTVRGISYVALGSFGTVSSLMSSTLSRRPPFGTLDAPAAAGGATGGNAVHVAGWVLDTAHLATVSVLLDGQLLQTLPVAASRPDVCALYPAYDGCPGVGFDGTVPAPALADGCAHLLRVLAADGDGNVTVLGERAISAH
jgi:hypothetical protein